MNRIAIVLHRPIYPRNVGMCARALANMGGTRLIIVGREEPLGDEAKQGAAHAQDVLRNATFYKSLEEFYASEGEGVRIALSGKDARLKVPDDLEETVVACLAEPEHRLHDRNDTIYLIFGTEDDGLSAEEMDLCHYVCRLPTFSDVNSLNLSHAVLLATYIVRTALSRTGAGEAASAATAKAGAVEYPQKLIHEWLLLLGFDLSSPRINIEKTLNKIFLSRAPTAEDLRLFSNVLNQTIRRLKK
jgi:TrmH family RNA methyltransferase